MQHQNSNPKPITQAGMEKFAGFILTYMKARSTIRLNYFKWRLVKKSKRVIN